MKLNAICIIKNEADIVIETIERALDYCDNIYVFDNGSTDGSYELLKNKAAQDNRVVIVAHTDEVYRNQFRNRVYNMLHHQFSSEDWWYILDADEMLVEDPRPMLQKAVKRNKTQMRVWQAQFYFTEKDLNVYDQEDHTTAVAQRRRYYRINWREPRFFKNDPQKSWPEDISGKVPPFCKAMYRPSPICRHYAERTPEQIKMRREIRLSNPYSFLHVKNKGDDEWLKKSVDCFYYNPGEKMRFPLADRAVFYASEFRYWCIWRVKNLFSLGERLVTKLA